MVKILAKQQGRYIPVQGYSACMHGSITPVTFWKSRLYTHVISSSLHQATDTFYQMWNNVLLSSMAIYMNSGCVLECRDAPT